MLLKEALNAERSRAKRRAEGGAGVTCYALYYFLIYLH